MLVQGEWSGDIQITIVSDAKNSHSLLKPDQVTHRPNGKVEDNVHVPRVEPVDQVNPFLQGTIMRI